MKYVDACKFQMLVNAQEREGFIWLKGEVIREFKFGFRYQYRYQVRAILVVVGFERQTYINPVFYSFFDKDVKYLFISIA